MINNILELKDLEDAMSICRAIKRGNVQGMNLERVVIQLDNMLTVIARRDYDRNISDDMMLMYKREIEDTLKFVGSIKRV